MRVRPRRETRGVSRSKCGDLITACVPVSWATSIIVHESTDAIDYYDGFGTSELVVGIRAYQWGWEYYYPKDVDLNYNIKNNYSSFVGNSLKYHSTTSVNLSSNNMWKFYQNKNLDAIVTPAHLLFIPIDNFKILNFLNFNDIGANPLNESVSFKKIKMFSKVSNSSLINSVYNFNAKQKLFFSFFFNDNSYLDSLNFGLKRQHNFLNNFSLNSNHSTFFSLKSTNKWVNFNFELSPSHFSFSNFFEKNQVQFSINNLLISKFFDIYFYNLNNLQKLIYFPNINQILNDDSDKKKVYYPIYKLHKIFKKSTFLGNSDNFFKFYSTHDVNNLKLEGFDLFVNTNKTYKNFTIFSSNQSIPLTSKNFRNFLNIKPVNGTFNHNVDLTTTANYFNFNNKNINTNNYFLFNLNYSNWIDLQLFNKYSANRIYLDSPNSPIMSNNPHISTLNFDSSKDTFIEDVPTFFQGKEDQLPAHLVTTYWNFYWMNSDTGWRLKNDFNYKNLHHKFYFPLFNFYYDYDFRNWQSLELLEDSFWESVYSIYTLDEYLSITDDFYNFEPIDKFYRFYLDFNKVLILKNDVFPRAHDFFLENNIENFFYSNFFYLDDSVSNSSLIKNSSFAIFPILNIQQIIDDSYEVLKFLNYFYNNSGKIFLFNSSFAISPFSLSTVFNVFRSDYEELIWFFNDKNFTKNDLSFFANYNFFYNFYLNDSNLNIFFNLTGLSKFLISNFEFIESTDFFKVFRFTDHINLRSPIKNSIVTYNALQKVFRARFDEGRSNAKLNDYANSYTKQMYITESKFKYEKFLGKNKEYFFNLNFYKNNNLNNFNNFYDFFTATNFYTFDFPFLLAMKSDASRYLWFDWFAKWGFYEVQPSSSSRYAIYGMPYFNKNFEFNSQVGENLIETETYFLRIAKARKNYLPNWTHSTYFYFKTLNWFKNNLFFELNNSKKELFLTEFYLNSTIWYWNDLYFLNFNSWIFAPSSSNINSFAKSFWRPQNSIQSYYYANTVLIDILSKREYLYREYFDSKNKLVNLPSHLSASISNPLVNEIKSAFFFIDPILFSNEYSRDVYFNSLNFFNFNIFKSFLDSLIDSLNISPFANYLFYYILGNEKINFLKNNQELLQNQYRPMRKGITNMIRLHATGAVAMPIEIRLQILASSKDVIHSWAIPSAGIKIDCVPGYSSHKVTIFLVSGIFWGQCMEICGRYHHWMPIIVYFMKRDLFFLWCTHFVFLSGSNSGWNINDRSYTDYVRLASYDKLSWLSEMNNI